jgi:transposase-like protein
MNATTAENQLKERVIVLYNSGVPSSHIARRLHIPRNLVNYIIKSEPREVRR